ncbi:MAG: YdcF family protein [Oscillospiraceae bacterium]|nr:YdcF family protein [Oscillospiraceae bacterium]
MILPILGALCLLGAVYFLLPLAMGVCHIGMFWPAAILLILAVAFFFPRLWEKRADSVKVIVLTLFSLGITAVLTVFVLMGMAAADRPTVEEAAPETVILLGCRVYEGKPSTMLQNRIDAAYDYLTAHPEAVVITTGGLDSKSETITQGGCAAETLIAMGIDPARVYAEEKSFDTRENLLFAAEIIEENNLDTHVVIASDNFHQLRGQIYAREAGLDPRAAGCGSPILLGAGYACREVLGILAAVVGLE